MTESELRLRTRQFALRVMQLVDALPRTKSGDVIGRQLLRSGTSVGANYRAACMAKSLPDFVNKLGIVEEEADESVYWMELICEAKLIPEKRLLVLMQEGEELFRIIASSRITAKRNAKAASSISNRKSQIAN